MNNITQEARYRQLVLKYEQNHGTAATARRYNISAKTIWKWRKRYDGTAKSLNNRSSRPHTLPRAHKEEWLRLVKFKLRLYGKTDLIRAFQAAKEENYPYSYGSFKRIARRLNKGEENVKPAKRKPKPYERAEYPGQKVQVDVKYVPSSCVKGDGKFYQYTAKDECTRWTYRQMYDEHNTTSSTLFLKELIEKAPFLIRMIQTDNGTEFTKALLTKDENNLSLFEQTLKEYGIEYKRIRPATPRHNGKVERQHRTDEKRLYSWLFIKNLNEGREKLAEYQEDSNNIIMTCLNMRTPNQVLEDYLAVI